MDSIYSIVFTRLDNTLKHWDLTALLKRPVRNGLCCERVEYRSGASIVASFGEKTRVGASNCLIWHRKPSYQVLRPDSFIECMHNKHIK